MKKITAFVMAALFSSFALHAEELTAKQLSENAVAKKSPEKAIEYLNSQIGTITVPAEKRAAYAFLASVQENIARYSDAQKSYAAAASIAGGNAEGMPKKSSERLVLDAIRCALSEGDWENAENYLNSAVRNSKNPEIQAQIKLYEQWSALCKAESQNDLIEPVAMLKAYLQIPSLEPVKRQILLTLWFLTGEKEYSASLSKEYPKSAECEIINGNVQLYPAPFWYFTPRKQPAKSADNKIVVEKVSAVNKEEVFAAPEAKKDESAPAPAKEEKPKKHQLGLFRDKSNAQNFVSQLNDKGFTAYIQEETRNSGIVYYSVVIDENAAGNMSDKIRSAGFECYPVF